MRILKALTEKREPDEADAVALRRAAEADAGKMALDDLARDVIARGLRRG